MAITVQEAFKSREGEAKSHDRKYIVRGSDDDAAIRAAADAEAPATSDAGDKQSTGITIEQLGPDLWTADVPYGPTSFDTTPFGTGEQNFTFSTGGATQHIMSSLETVAVYNISGLTPAVLDNGNLIGVTEDSVEGVDITTPAYTWSETYYIDNASITSGYRGTLFARTGTTNNASWTNGFGDTFAEGEVLFLGASGQRRGRNGDWEITFNFAGSPNVTGLTVGAITGIAKKGWEYIWFRTKQVKIGGVGLMSRKPICAYVEKVYRSADFDDIYP